MLAVYIAATAVANAAIGGGWLTRGLVFLAWFLVIGFTEYMGKGAVVRLFVLFGLILSITVTFALWRSQSPRGADLDLVWEPTWDEAKNTALRHGIPLVIIAIISAYHSLYSLLLPLCVIVPIVSHAAASNKTAMGRWLLERDKSRRFGEFISGGLCYAPALWVLSNAFSEYIPWIMTQIK